MRSVFYSVLIASVGFAALKPSSELSDKQLAKRMAHALKQDGPPLSQPLIGQNAQARYNETHINDVSRFAIPDSATLDLSDIIAKTKADYHHQILITNVAKPDDAYALPLVYADSMLSSHHKFQRDLKQPITPILLSADDSVVEMRTNSKEQDGRFVPTDMYVNMRFMNVSLRAFRWKAAHETGHDEAALSGLRTIQNYDQPEAKQREEYYADSVATALTRDKTGGFIALGRSICTPKALQMGMRQLQHYLLNILNISKGTYIPSMSHYPPLSNRLNAIDKQVLPVLKLKDLSK